MHGTPFFFESHSLSVAVNILILVIGGITLAYAVLFLHDAVGLGAQDLGGGVRGIVSSANRGYGGESPSERRGSPICTLQHEHMLITSLGIGVGRS